MRDAGTAKAASKATSKKTRQVQDNGVPSFNPTSGRRFSFDGPRVQDRSGTARDITVTTGKVTLLSAGPGDLDLLTIKAAKLLASGDVVLLDDLVNPEIVTLAPQARVIRVGKRGGCKSTPQAFIQRLILRYARAGKHVVRVKGGDALLFGRAGEELAELRRAQIPFEIVNGISSGFAAAAALGISLTHRDYCQGVTFVTAHLRYHSEPDWGALAATGTTLAIYMGMSRIDGLCEALMKVLPHYTPAAVVQCAGCEDERRVVATLETVAALAHGAGLGSPAVILVGQAIGEAVRPVVDECIGDAVLRSA